MATKGYIAQTAAEADRLGYRKSKRSPAEIHSHVGGLMEKSIVGDDGFSKPCGEAGEGNICLQSDCGSDGIRSVCYCKGGRCDDCRDVDC